MNVLVEGNNKIRESGRMDDWMHVKEGLGNEAKAEERREGSRETKPRNEAKNQRETKRRSRRDRGL